MPDLVVRRILLSFLRKSRCETFDQIVDGAFPQGHLNNLKLVAAKWIVATLIVVFRVSAAGRMSGSGKL